MSSTKYAGMALYHTGAILGALWVMVFFAVAPSGAPAGADADALAALGSTMQYDVVALALISPLCFVSGWLVRASSKFAVPACIISLLYLAGSVAFVSRTQFGFNASLPIVLFYCAISAIPLSLAIFSSSRRLAGP